MIFLPLASWGRGLVDRNVLIRAEHFCHFFSALASAASVDAQCKKKLLWPRMRSSAIPVFRYEIDFDGVLDYHHKSYGFSRWIPYDVQLMEKNLLLFTNPHSPGVKWEGQKIKTAFTSISSTSKLIRIIIKVWQFEIIFKNLVNV